ncbi:MAG: hypothetical protein HZA67_09720 [Rhodospirillales bacterium]|nr:hypothetical protein [Rhodospirillales bacterium]
MDSDPNFPAEEYLSPVILDLDGDGVETTGLAVQFDHDGNGFAEQSAWVSADDGLLVLDIDGSGTIDDGSELFGNNTALADGTLAANGFAALAQYDDNEDGVISSGDSVWNSLRVWKDGDQDGVTDAGELLTMSQAGASVLSLSYATSSHTDANGNQHRQVGSYTRTGGTTAAATDVWFKVNPIQSVATEPVTVPPELAALPEMEGSGNVRRLQEAMTLDATLAGLVTQFVSETQIAARNTLIEQILLRWTGADQTVPGSRGEPVEWLLRLAA